MKTFETISILTSIFMAIIILIAAFKTNLLKERDDDKAPYSLSKFQLWIWTFTICPLFALNWGFHYPNNPTINKTSLILLGMAAAVTLLSGIVGQTNATNAKNKYLLKEETNTRGFWIDLLTGDENKTPTERLQNLIFTFIYIVIYVSFFFDLTDYTDPITHIKSKTLMNYITFDDMAYILMGISSGSYLLGKSIRMNK